LIQLEALLRSETSPEAFLGDENSVSWSVFATG